MAKTPSFITELRLKVNREQERRLLVRLEAVRQVYNACLGESLKRLKLMRESREYQAVRKLPKGEPKSDEWKERAAAFVAVRRRFQFSEYALHEYAKQFGHSWLGEHLDSHVVQKIATRAYKAVMRYGIGRAGRPRFKGKNQIDSVEGKSNKTGIMWREGLVLWKGLVLQPIYPKKPDPVIEHGLGSRVKYVRIVRRKLNGRNRFYVQLVCEGFPYHKAKNEIGEGDVGIDIGPSTIAIVAPEAKKAELRQFCWELKTDQKEIRRLQRKLDRQRRANNPDGFNPNGTVKPGKREWKVSMREKETRRKLSELLRKQAEYRKSLHGNLANHIFSLGNTIKLEKLSYRAFQRRFGKSVGMRAPGKFVEILRRKAASAGNLEIFEFPTRSTRLSQTCICGNISKKHLSQRWHTCDCGVSAQRDLLSAFLASCVEVDSLNADLVSQRWSGMDTCLQAALSNIPQLANGLPLPSSFGINPRRQSESPVKVLLIQHETRVAVPPTLSGAAGRTQVSAAPARTPRL